MNLTDPSRTTGKAVRGLKKARPHREKRGGKWHEEGLGLQASDENEYLNYWLETPGEIRENLLNRMNMCIILAVRLHSIISHVNRSKK